MQIQRTQPHPYSSLRPIPRQLCLLGQDEDKNVHWAQWSMASVTNDQSLPWPVPNPDWPDEPLFLSLEGTGGTALSKPSPPPPKRQRPAAPGAKITIRTRVKGKIRLGSKDAIAGLGAGMDADSWGFWRQVRPCPWGCGFCPGVGGAGEESCPTCPLGFSARGGQTGFSGWGAGPQALSKQLGGLVSCVRRCWGWVGGNGGWQ